MSESNVLIMTSVEAEKQAIEAGLGRNRRFHVKLAGVGPVEAAVATALELARGSYQYVLNMGIAGGFEERTPVGSIVIASRQILADLGVQTDEGFQKVEALGFGQSTLVPDETYVDELTLFGSDSNISMQVGEILTLSTVTGTAKRTIELKEQYPKAAAEAMEGFGVGLAASKVGIPFMEVRAISNVIGPRDRDAWRIADALQALKETSQYITEVL
ncbi:futalosine hydrolase [Halalkalibacter sp. AB-rgal2]|uniref:futalosine hydrolase n=1 Tax=Halalkalibacter sp. AB-rgal2 TaxID=3242695 RepID=UPI00359F0272